MTADSCVEGIAPQHADALLDAVSLDRCYHAAPLVIAEPSLSGIQDVTKGIQFDKFAISAIGKLEALPEPFDGEAQPPRERTSAQRQSFRASTDTFSTSQPSAESNLEMSVVLAKRMAELALQRPSSGGTAAPNPTDSCTPDRDTATEESSLIHERPQTHHIRRKAQVSQPTSLNLPSGDPNSAEPTAAGAVSNAALGATPDVLVAAASAAALAAAVGSSRLASIAVARQPPPPGEIKIHPSKPNKRAMMAPRSGDRGHYRLTVYTSYSKEPSPASGQTSDSSSTTPAPTLTQSLSSTAPLHMNWSSSSSSPASWRGSRSPSASPAALYRFPGALADRRRRGGGRSPSSAFDNDAIAFVAARSTSTSLPGHSDGGCGVATTPPSPANDILVNHGKLLVDRELLAAEVRRLASQVQHLTVQQGMLQEELQRLLNQNSNLNSALASTVTTCESQAELMDILSEAVRSTVLVDEHDMAAAAAIEAEGKEVAGAGDLDAKVVLVLAPEGSPGNQEAEAETAVTPTGKGDKDETVGK